MVLFKAQAAAFGSLLLPVVQQLEISPAGESVQVGSLVLCLEVCTIQVLCNFKTIKTISFSFLVCLDFCFNFILFVYLNFEGTSEQALAVSGGSSPAPWKSLAFSPYL